jgi:hypothetical protein
MLESPRAGFFAKLKEELNPTIWVTEWLSHRLMDVEWVLDESAEKTINHCISGIDEILTARGFENGLVHEILEKATEPSQTKAEFERAWQQQALVIESQDIDALALLSIYCFLHIAFTYER